MTISIQFTGQGGLHIFTGSYEYFMCSSNESGVNRGTGVVSNILISPAYIELAAEFFYFIMSYSRLWLVKIQNTRYNTIFRTNGKAPNRWISHCQYFFMIDNYSF